MRIDIITLFPEFFESCLSVGLLGKALKERVTCSTIDPRQYTHDVHRTVDDTPFDGGAGIDMKPAPI